MSGEENGRALGERSDGLLLLCMQRSCCNNGVVSCCGLGFWDGERALFLRDDANRMK